MTAEDLWDLYAEYVVMEETFMEHKLQTTVRGRQHRPDPRNKALSSLVALEAGRRADVVAFRDEALPGGLLPTHETIHWIETRLHEEGRREASWETCKALLVPIGPLVGQSLWRLRFEWIPRGGLLERLHDLSQAHAERCSWRVQDATMFVLTDEVPDVQPFLFELLRPDGGEQDVQQPAYEFETRIRLNLNVRVSPRDLLMLYEAIREDVLDIRRDRPISRRHTELGMFAFAHRRGMTWAETLRLWNERHADRQDAEDWVYEEEAPFVRDARQAFRRITGDALVWEGKSSPPGDGVTASVAAEGGRKKVPKAGGQSSGPTGGRPPRSKTKDPADPKRKTKEPE